MDFIWDEKKNLDNISKHGVSFDTAKQAFFDEKRIIILDEKHLQDEVRYFCIGDDGVGINTVRFTMREKSVRIFGAGYWREGRSRYEQENG